MPSNNSKPICSECGSSNVIPIMYGLPTEAAAEEAMQGSLKLATTLDFVRR